MAVNMLAEAGFQKVYNIVDGMEGDAIKDPDNVYYGKRMKNGWKNSGLPWTYDVNPNRCSFPGSPVKHPGTEGRRIASRRG